MDKLKRKNLTPILSNPSPQRWSFTFLPVSFFFKLMFISFWEKENSCTKEMQRERERETGDPKQALHWQHRARFGAWTYKSQDHDLNWNQTLNDWASGTPTFCLFLLNTSRNFPYMYKHMHVNLLWSCYVYWSSTFSFFQVYLFEWGGVQRES